MVFITHQSRYTIHCVWTWGRPSWWVMIRIKSALPEPVPVERFSIGCWPSASVPLPVCVGWVNGQKLPYTAVHISDRVSVAVFKAAWRVYHDPGLSKAVALHYWSPWAWRNVHLSQSRCEASGLFVAMVSISWRVMTENSSRHFLDDSDVFCSIIYNISWMLLYYFG